MVVVAAVDAVQVGRRPRYQPQAVAGQLLPMVVEADLSRRFLLVNSLLVGSKAGAQGPKYSVTGECLCFLLADHRFNDATKVLRKWISWHHWQRRHWAALPIRQSHLR